MGTFLWIIALILVAIVSFLLGRNLTDLQFRRILADAFKLCLNAELSNHERAVRNEAKNEIHFIRGAITGLCEAIYEINRGYHYADYTSEKPLFSGRPLGANQLGETLAEQLRAYDKACMIEAAQATTETSDARSMAA